MTRGPRHRVIAGLRWAKPSPRPAGLPIGRPRGAKAAGLRYERDLAATLPLPSVHGQWIEYCDAAGKGFAQIDLVVASAPAELAILEAKYTWIWEGHSQVERLYLPLLRSMSGKACLGIVVCKVLRSGMPSDIAVCATLEEALAAARQGRRAVWHWLPVALGPSRRNRQSAALRAAHALV